MEMIKVPLQLKSNSSRSYPFVLLIRYHLMVSLRFITKASTVTALDSYDDDQLGIIVAAPMFVGSTRLSAYTIVVL